MNHPPAVEAIESSSPALRWARDFALLGLVTCTTTPLSAQPWLPFDLTRYALHAGATGFFTGALVGLGCWTFLGRFPERSRPAIALLTGPIIAGAWGALVAGGWSVLDHPGYWPLAIPCGAISGTLQGVWWVPLRAWLEPRRTPTWPIAMLSGLGSPFLGMAGVFGVVRLMELLT